MSHESHLNPKPEDFTLTPSRAYLAEARLMTDEARKGNHTPDGWKNVPVRVHAARAVRHGLRFLIHGELEDLIHARTRFGMALEMRLEEDERRARAPIPVLAQDAAGG